MWFENLNLHFVIHSTYHFLFFYIQNKPYILQLFLPMEILVIFMRLCTCKFWECSAEHEFANMACCTASFLFQRLKCVFNPKMQGGHRTPPLLLQHAECQSLVERLICVFNPKMKGGGGTLRSSPHVVFCPLLKISLSNPYLKILDLSKLYIADAHMQKNIEDFRFTLSQSTLKYGSENRQ